MDISIKGIKDSKIHNKERLILNVLDNDNLGNYIVFDTTYINETSVSNKVRHSYWFPDKEVKKGDLVVLYTHTGTSSSHKNANGTSTHFYYWNLGINVWNDDGDAALLVLVNDWQFKQVK